MRLIRSSGAFASLFLALLLAGPLRADQVVLKNGDRVTGAVVKKDGNLLIVKTDQFGAVPVAWDQIASIRTDKPVNIVLADGRKAKATMATAGAVVEIAAQPPISVAPSEITTLRDNAEQGAFDRLQHPGWSELWAGTAAVGLGDSGQRGGVHVHRGSQCRARNQYRSHKTVLQRHQGIREGARREL